jgi:hypothetical protein
MREPWSVNALSLALGPDRRTVTKWLERAAVKPAGDGPKGPTYRLRDAVDVLADAGLLGERDRASTWQYKYGGMLGAREFARRLRSGLAKRLPDETMRGVREVLTEELFRYIGQCQKQMRWRRLRPDAPAWGDMTDAELSRALASLVDLGQLEAEQT